MSVDTSLPVTNPKDDVDEYVRQYFSEYFSENHVVDENDFELVKSFFMTKTDNPSNPSVAANTVAVLLAADQLNIYPSDIIQRIDTPDYKKTFALILNLTRQGTSLIGYEDATAPGDENNRQVTI